MRTEPIASVWKYSIDSVDCATTDAGFPKSTKQNAAFTTVQRRVEGPIISLICDETRFIAGLLGAAPRLRQAFQLFDRNRDGKLDDQERAALMELVRSLVPEQ